MRIRLPNLPLTVTVVSWGFNFVAVKLMYREMTAPALSLVRFIVMYLCLVGICSYQKESLRYQKDDWYKVLFAGFLALGVYMVLFLEGVVRTTPAEAAIVLSSAPIFTYLFACLFKQERFLWGAVVGAVVGFCGVSVVIL